MRVNTLFVGHFYRSQEDRRLLKRLSEEYWAGTEKNEAEVILGEVIASFIPIFKRMITGQG